ncbi:MAG: hypothetical protein ACR2GY_03980 [Phycisphaerales bacterium]
MHRLRKNRKTTRVARRRRRKATRRRDLSKFIPSADSDFAFTAVNFMRHLEAFAEESDVPDLEIELLGRAVREYRSALTKATHRTTRTEQAIGEKNAARKEAEDRVRLVANMIRTSPYVSASHKQALRLKEQPKRKKARKCPTRPPLLEFLGSGDGVAQGAGTGGGSGLHVLRFWDYEPPVPGQRLDRKSKSKPEGAVRLELFVDLVPAGEPLPQSPLDRVRMGRGWPWYLRSFTKNPIEVEFPLAAQPMLVVYWARWADSAGETSRFSNTCVARIEGWTPTLNALPEGGSCSASAQPRVGIIEPRQLQGRGAGDADVSYRIEAKCVLVQLPGAEPRMLPSADDAMWS